MIFVRDLGAMERFYRGVLGLVPVEASRSADWVEFDTGEGRFSLHQIPPHNLPGVAPLVSEPREGAAVKLSFAVSDLTAEAARLRGLGVRVIERPWGGFDFADPEGNVVGLSGPPGALAAAGPEPLLAEPVPEAPSEVPPMKPGLLDNRLPPLVVTLLFGWVMGSIAGLVPQVSFLFAARGLAAAVPALLGLAIMLVAALQFRAAKTTVDPRTPAKASSLVTGGLFRLSRNPMYLGMLLVLAGWAVFLCNPAVLLGLWGFVLFVNRFQIGPEERAFRAHFGAEFDAYAAKVRRWI